MLCATTGVYPVLYNLFGRERNSYFTEGLTQQLRSRQRVRTFLVNIICRQSIVGIQTDTMQIQLVGHRAPPLPLCLPFDWICLSFACTHFLFFLQKSASACAMANLLIRVWFHVEATHWKSYPVNSHCTKINRLSVQEQ